MHFDNLLFLLLVAVALLFRWLASKAGQTSKGSEESERGSTSTPQAPPPISHSPAEADEERVRKFLEALGQPAGSRPPPPVVHRTDIPPRPVAPVRPQVGRLSPSPWQLTREEKRKRRYLPTETSKAAPLVFEVHEVAPHAMEPVTSSSVTPLPEPAPPIKSPAEAYAIATEPRTDVARRKTNIVVLLRSSSGLRNAIILREIFGPPRSLQPLDLVGQNL
jgi:hypothetical protein